MSLSTWPGANITSSPGFQLAGTALIAGASLVHPARIPGYRFFRPLKAKIIAGVAIVAVVGVILLTPSADTNISTNDAALEDSITRMNQDSLDRDVWTTDGREIAGEDGNISDDLLSNSFADDIGLSGFPMDQLAARLGLHWFRSILHKTISEPLRTMDAHLHEVPGFGEDWGAMSPSYLGRVDTVYHVLDRNSVFDWSLYTMISTALFIRLFVGIVRRMCKYFFGRQRSAIVKPEVSLISDFVFAEPNARTERYVPELDASLQLFATISLERDGHPHSTGYIFDMYNDGSHTGKLLVQRPASPDAVRPSGFQSLLESLRRYLHVSVSFVATVRDVALSLSAWFCGKFKTNNNVRREASQGKLEQSLFKEENTPNEDSSPSPPDLSENELMGLDVNGVVDIDETENSVLSESESPITPESRASYHSVDSTLADDDAFPAQLIFETPKEHEEEVVNLDCMDLPSDTEEGGSSTEKLLRGATRAVDELLSSTNADAEKTDNRLYKSMRIVKDLLAALSGQIAALDIPEDDYSHYFSDDEEGQSELEQTEKDQSCSELALITDTQSGFTYQCTSHGDDDSLTLKFTVKDSDKEASSSSVPSGELSLIRKKDGPQASGSCTTVIATGSIFSPPYAQAADPDVPMFVVVPGFRRHRKRPKNRSRGKGRVKHSREADPSTDSE